MAKNKTKGTKKASKGTPASKTRTAAKSEARAAAIKPSSSSDDNMDDWISSLAKQAASSETTRVLSKEDRKRKRTAKRAKRQGAMLSEPNKQAPSRSAAAAAASQPSSSQTTVLRRRLQVAFTKRRMEQIASILEQVRNDYNQRSKRDHPRPYQIPPNKKRKTKGWSEATIQPRPSDYSGIGLARDSLYMQFKDPSFFPSLEEEFREHITGFFGKQRTKAMKRQLDKDMLWRKMTDKKIMSKRFQNMTPDQRVEAMLEAGML